MKWFGKSWGAPVCDAAAHVETPVLHACGYCDRAIEPTDGGFLLPVLRVAPSEPTEIAFHRRCFLMSVGIKDLEHIVLRPCVHILHHGEALCGFGGVEFRAGIPRLVPGQWPSSHKWVRLGEEGATCEHCIAAANNRT